MTQPTTTGLPSKPCRESGPEEFLRISSGADAWVVRRDRKARVLGAGSPDWFALEAEPRATRVKAGRLRMVWVIGEGADAVYAKVAEHSGWVHRLKRLLVGDAAEREMRACTTAAARGLPVAHAMAVGRRGGSPGISVLLSEGVAGGVPLSDAWSNAVASDSRERRRAATRGYIDAAADLFACSHERGFLHGDAHPSNVLTTLDAEGRIATTWIDLKAAKFRRGPVPRTPSIRSLVQLDQYFHRRATRTDRLRFLKRYLAARPLATNWLGGALRDFASQLARERRRHNANLVAQRDRRLLRRGHYFTTIEIGQGWTAVVALRLERRHMFAEPNVPDRDRRAWSVLARSIVARGDAIAHHAQPTTFETQGLSCEVRSIQGAGARLTATLFGSPHRALFTACHRERHRDVQNELILGVAERRRDGFIDRSILIRPGERGNGV